MFKETLSPEIWAWHSVPTPETYGETIHTYLHYGETIEIIFTSGVEGEATVNGKKFTIKNKTAIYIAPKQLHSVEYFKGGEFIRVLHIDLELLSRYINIKNILSAEGRSLTLIPNKCKDFNTLYKNALIIAGKTSTISEKLLATLEIIKNLISSFDESMLSSPSDNNASKLMDWIEKNYTRKITTKDAADFFGYNKNYFSRWVKITVGTSFTDFLNSVKISHACTYLADGCTIEDTAEKCGYSDPSYFIKVFKKLRGTTPKNYITKNRDNDGY